MNGSEFLSAGISEGQPAFDRNLARLFVPDSGGTISVVSTTTNTRIGIVNGTFNQPVAAVYDPALDRVYVSNFGNGSLAIVNPHTLALVGYVNAPVASSGPLLYLNGSQSLLVADNAVPGYLFWVDPATGADYAIEAGQTTSLAWDPATDLAVGAIDQNGSNFLFAFDDATGFSAFLASENSQTLVTYDSAAAVFVTVNQTGDVNVYPGSNVSTSGIGSPLFIGRIVPGHGSPYDLAYDPAARAVVLTRTTGFGSWIDFLQINRTGVFTRSEVSGSLLPAYPTYDPVNQNLYVPGLTRLQVLGATTDTVVASRNVPKNPQNWYAGAAVYVPPTNQIWVPSNNFSIVELSEATHAVVGSFFFGYATGLLYDPPLGAVVATDGSGYLGVINVTTHAVGYSFVGNASIIAATYDPVHQTLVASDDQFSTVRVVGAKNLTPLANLSVSSTPTGGAFDPATGEVVVADFFGSNLSVINGTTHVREIPGSYSGDTLAYDPSTKQLALFSCTGAGVEFFDALTYKFVTSGAGLYQLACGYDLTVYDPADGQLFAFGRNGGPISPDGYTFNARDTVSGVLYGTYNGKWLGATGIVFGAILDPVTDQIVVVADDGIYWINP